MAQKSEARLYRHRRGWRVVWRWAGRQYAIKCADEATGERARAAVVVGLLSGRWAEWIASSPAVRRYREDRAAGAASGDKGAKRRAAAAAGAKEEYLAIIGGEVTKQWKKQTGRVLDRLAAAAGGDLAAVTTAQAAAWLDEARTAATRNQRLVVLKKFYKWAERAKGWNNPVAGLRQRVAARAQTDIEAYTAEEREAMLAYAKTVRRGVAVAIALLAGLRLNEIMRLRWRDVDLKAGRLMAQSKRGQPRAVPISRRLAAFLKERQKAGAESDPRGDPEALEERVVGVRGMIGMRRICERMRQKFPAFSWQICRHTFCSLLAQAGVSLDKVCAWSGHEPGVCRRHYARFVPKNRRDEEIDLVDKKPRRGGRGGKGRAG